MVINRYHLKHPKATEMSHQVRTKWRCHRGSAYGGFSTGAWFLWFQMIEIQRNSWAWIRNFSRQTALLLVYIYIYVYIYIVGYKICSYLRQKHTMKCMNSPTTTHSGRFYPGRPNHDPQILSVWDDHGKYGYWWTSKRNNKTCWTWCFRVPPTL